MPRKARRAPRAWGAGIQGFRARSSRVSKTPSPPGTWLATPLTAATRNSRRKWGKESPEGGRSTKSTAAATALSRQDRRRWAP